MIESGIYLRGFSTCKTYCIIENECPKSSYGRIVLTFGRIVPLFNGSKYEV